MLGRPVRVRLGSCCVKWRVLAAGRTPRHLCCFTDNNPDCSPWACPLLGRMFVLLLQVIPQMALQQDRDTDMGSEFFETRQAFLSLCQGNHYQVGVGLGLGRVVGWGSAGVHVDYDVLMQHKPGVMQHGGNLHKPAEHARP